MLKPPKDQRKAAESVFTSSVVLLANTVAFIAAFLLTGPVYSHTHDPVRNFAVSQYGASMGDVASILWGLAVAIGVFAIARLSLATAITVGGLALAARLF